MSSHSPSPAPGAPRKPHCCRSCGLPMKGHQRGACVDNNPMYPRSSSPLSMPPPNNIPSRTSQPGARFSSPNTRPIMPGTYGNERPSEISVPSGPSPSRSLSLRERIGPKIEEDSILGVPYYEEETYDQQYPRHASVPLHGFPTMMAGGSASASGSVYGSSPTIVLPEHSISQRFIRRDRAVSENPNPLIGRLGDRLSGYASDDYIGADNGGYDDDDSFEYDRSFDIDEEDESDPAYPSDGSAIGGGASASYYASESEAGTFTTSGLSSAPSFGALMRGSGAAPLYTVYEVASKYVQVLRNRAKRKGYAVQVIPSSPNDDIVDEHGHRKRSSREPGNVKILLGRDEDALREIARQQRSGSAMPSPSRQIRVRARSSVNDMQGRHPSPHFTPPPHLANPYPAPQPGVPYPPPVATVAPPPPQAQSGSLGNVCLIVTITLAVSLLVIFALIGFYVIVMSGSSSE